MATGLATMRSQEYIGIYWPMVLGLFQVIRYDIPPACPCLFGVGEEGARCGRRIGYYYLVEHIETFST